LGQSLRDVVVPGAEDADDEDDSLLEGVHSVLPLLPPLFWDVASAN
jgi:hypothetical protein